MKILTSYGIKANQSQKRADYIFKDYRINTLRIIDLPYQVDAEPLFARLRTLPGAIWLDSGKPHSLYGQFDIITAAPDITLETRQGVTIQTNQTGQKKILKQDSFLAANTLLEQLEPIDIAHKNLPFTGGLMGYWGYDLTQENSANHITSPTTDLPDMKVGRYLWSLILNHSTRTAHIVAHKQCPQTLLDEVLKRLQSEDPLENHFSLTQPFLPSSSKQQYLAAVEKIRHYITAGDCYQVNLAQHFKASYSGDTWQAYKLLRKALPSPFSAYMAWDDKAILSLSPERFLQLSNRHVETKPIKGTIARGKTMQQDQQLAIELQNSLKDRAENLMIVDLLRNDLGKTCQPGSIKVPKLFDLESYQNVHHLVSTIKGTLKPQHTALDLLQGCFPGGSITGAPKKRAMEIINELEEKQRGIYCGSIGYISINGHMDSNIAIRTLVADNNQLHCWGGGGIVADSAPHSEYEESIQKVRILMETLESTGS